jgi:hypothetical protein
MATRVAAQYALHDTDELPLCRVTVRPRAAPLRRAGSGGAGGPGAAAGSPRLRAAQAHHGPACPVAFASGAERDPLGLLGTSPAARGPPGGAAGGPPAVTGRLAARAPGGSGEMDAAALAALGHLAAAVAAAKQAPAAAPRPPSCARGRRGAPHPVAAGVPSEA